MPIHVPLPNRRVYPIKPDDPMPFGKYKGDPAWLVIETDWKYIDWCFENVDGFELDSEAYSLYLKQLGK